MNYFKYFTSYFSSEKTYSPVKKDDETKIVKTENYDEFDEQVINSVNKQMLYNVNLAKSNVNLAKDNVNLAKSNENTPLINSSNKTNKIKFARKNSL